MTVILSQRGMLLNLVRAYYFSMCPTRRTGKSMSICTASVDHVNYRIELDLMVSLHWSKMAGAEGHMLAQRTSNKDIPRQTALA